jgi:predicted transposase/invertase (TIGR01784 family)
MSSVNFIRGTKVYQEAKEEGRLEGRLESQVKLVQKLLQKGLSIQEVAELLELDPATVTEVASQQD